MADPPIDIVAKLAAALGVDMKESKPMGHLDSFAEDVNEVVADVERQFQLLNKRKQRLKESGAEIATRWAEHFAGQEKAMATAEIALNRISNVPISVAKDTPKDRVLSEVKNG